MYIQVCSQTEQKSQVAGYYLLFLQQKDLLISIFFLAVST